MRGRAALVLVACAAAAQTGCGASTSEPVRPAAAAKARLAGTPIPAGAPALDFALRDQDGRLVRLGAQRGKLVFVAFLYTRSTSVR